MKTRVESTECTDNEVALNPAKILSPEAKTPSLEQKPTIQVENEELNAETAVSMAVPKIRKKHNPRYFKFSAPHIFRSENQPLSTSNLAALKQYTSLQTKV